MSTYSLSYWERWERWREHLNYTTFNHGAALVEELGTPYKGKPGLPDNVAHAESILAELEVRGLIVKGKYAPTTQQQWFGINGGWKDSQMSGSLTAYGWTRGPRVITREALQGDASPERSDPG